jgi:hypothetical protein
MKKIITFLIMILVLIIMSRCEKISDLITSIQPLGTPKNVYARVSGNTLTLTWDAVKGAEQYHVFWKMTGYFGTSGQFLELIQNPTQPVYTDDLGRITGTTYTFQVCAERNKEFSARGTSNSVNH